MLRVRHTVNTAKGILLQFRDYIVTANKVEVVDDPKLNRKIDRDIGSWLCTFRRPKSMLNKPKIETSFISSKKKVVNKFKEFILSDFPKTEEYEEIPLIKATSATLTNISKLSNEIRKSIKEQKIVKVNTLINHTFLELNTLQLKISELENPKK